MSAIIDPRQLPIVELVPIYRVRVDGLIDEVRIVGGDFLTSFYELMCPVGSRETVRAPVLEIRRRLQDYTPNYLNSMVLEEQRRLERGTRPRHRMVAATH